MKKLSLLLISFIFIFKLAYASSYSSDPEIFIQELVTDSINKLSDKNISEEEKKNFIENVAIENVDINALSLYTLGELRKSTDKNTLESYQRVFKKYFLKSLTSRLTEYSSNKSGSCNIWSITVSKFFSSEILILGLPAEADLFRA